MPVTSHPHGLTLAIRLTPKAARNYIGQIEETANGSRHLKVYVTTVPEDGKANKSLLKLLAKELKWPVGKFSVASGATNRNKQILIEGDSTELAVRWQHLIAGTMDKDTKNDR